jgi:hypothetical protein
MQVIHKGPTQCQTHLLFLLLKLRIISSSCWQVFVRKPILLFFIFRVIRPIYLLLDGLAHGTDFSREPFYQILILFLILDETGHRLTITQHLRYALIQSLVGVFTMSALFLGVYGHNSHDILVFHIRLLISLRVDQLDARHQRLQVVG